MKIDIVSPSSTEDAARLVEREFGGKLDILVNNAGIFGSVALVADSDPEEWWSVWVSLLVD